MQSLHGRINLFCAPRSVARGTMGPASHGRTRAAAAGMAAGGRGARHQVRSNHDDGRLPGLPGLPGSRHSACHLLGAVRSALVVAGARGAAATASNCDTAGAARAASCPATASWEGVEPPCHCGRGCRTTLRARGAARVRATVRVCVWWVGGFFLGGGMRTQQPLGSSYSPIERRLRAHQRLRFASLLLSPGNRLAPDIIGL